jgi:signal transduction histidine kinase
MKPRAQQLEALNSATREFMAAESRKEVAQIGVEAARDILDLTVNAIHLYNEDESGLVPLAQTDTTEDLLGEPPILTAGDSIAWRVYKQGEPTAIDDVRTDSDLYNPDTLVRGELYLPLDEYGILIAASPTPETFDQDHLVVGEVLAANTVAALRQVERKQQLQTREQELIRQNDRLENFVSIVSHDLRNPLNVANARLELLAEECDSDHLGHIERANDRMEALIENLLMLARQGETVTERELIDLSALVNGCWANVETDDATIITDIDRTIRADESRLKQVFENLFRNAIEHSEATVTVTVGSLENGFYIEDNGPGIPDDARENVCEAGYSTQQGGTGFGLSIIEQIVEAHDWDIRVSEGNDGGARFEITGVESLA